MRAKWIKAAIRRADLIVIGQQSRLLFLPVIDTALHYEAIRCQSEWLFWTLLRVDRDSFSFVSREK